MTSSLVPGSLVQVNDRQGRYGILRSSETPEGYFSVEMFAVDKGELVCQVEYKPPVSVKSTRVRAISVDYGDRGAYRIQHMYYMKKALRFIGNDSGLGVCYSWIHSRC